MSRKNEKTQSQKNIVSLRWATLVLTLMHIGGGCKQCRAAPQRAMNEAFSRPFLTVPLNGSSLYRHEVLDAAHETNLLGMSQKESGVRKLRQRREGCGPSG